MFLAFIWGLRLMSLSTASAKSDRIPEWLMIYSDYSPLPWTFDTSCVWFSPSAALFSAVISKRHGNHKRDKGEHIELLDWVSGDNRLFRKWMKSSLDSRFSLFAVVIAMAEIVSRMTFDRGRNLTSFTTLQNVARVNAQNFGRNLTTTARHTRFPFAQFRSSVL